MNSTAEGNEFVHFDKYEDAVVAIELVGSQSADVQKRPTAVEVGHYGHAERRTGCDGARTQRHGRMWRTRPQVSAKKSCVVAAPQPRPTAKGYGILRDLLNELGPELMEGPVPNGSAEDHRNLQRLNELRRQFAHFNPTGWGIELNYILNIMPVALNLFEFLITTQRRPNIHFTEEHRDRMKNALARARAAVEAFNQALAHAPVRPTVLRRELVPSP